MRVEKRLFVFLQVALIARRQAFHRDQQADERGGDAAGFAANQFPRIGIFLLRHQAAAGGIFVGQNHEAEARRGEKNHVFREARKMAGQNRERVKIVERKIAAADGIEAVARDACEFQFIRKSASIHRKRAAAQRARAQRACVGRVGRERQAVEIVKKCLRVREQEMRKQNRLRQLHVRHAGHGNAKIRLPLEQGTPR